MPPLDARRIHIEARQTSGSGSFLQLDGRVGFPAHRLGSDRRSLGLNVMLHWPLSPGTSAEWVTSCGSKMWTVRAKRKRKV